MRRGLLVLALLAPLSPGLVAGEEGPCPEARAMPGVGVVCPSAVPGQLDVYNARREYVATIHEDADGPARDALAPGTAAAGAAARAPRCVEDFAEMDFTLVVYARAPDYAYWGASSSVAEISATLRDLAAQANALVHASGAARGQGVDMRFHCEGGQVAVRSVVLPTPRDDATFATIVTDLADHAPWARQARVKYMVFYDDPYVEGFASGRGHLYEDDRLSLDNFNNGRALMYGVTYGVLSARTMLHEWGHNMGAVQSSSPHTSGAGHCNDGLDVMCYADGGWRSDYDPTACAAVAWDCGGDDYFNVRPPPGSYLATRWNVASPLNRFIEHGPAAPPAGAVSGVLAWQGRPVPGASVAFAREGHATVVVESDEAGAFSATLAAGAWTATAEFPDERLRLASGSVAVSVSATRATTLRLVLAADFGALRLRTTGDADAPLTVDVRPAGADPDATPPVESCLLDPDAAALSCEHDGDVVGGMLLALAPGTYDVLLRGEDLRDAKAARIVVAANRVRDVTLPLVSRFATLTPTLRAQDVDAYDVAFSSGGVEIGRCAMDVRAQLAECAGDVRPAAWPSLLVPEGRVDVSATVGDADHKDFSRAGLQLAGGRAKTLPLSFAPARALVTVSMGSAHLESYALEFRDAGGATVGACDVDAVASAASCTGGVEAAGWPRLLVPDTARKLVVTAPEHAPLEKAMRLSGGRAARVDAAPAPGFPLLLASATGPGLQAYSVTLRDAAGVVVDRCVVDVEAGEASCEGASSLYSMVGGVAAFRVPASAGARWSVVLAPAGDQEDGGKPVALAARAFADGSVAVAKAALRPYTLVATVRGGAPATADVTLVDAAGRVHASSDRARAVFTWVAPGPATLEAVDDAGASATLAVAARAGATAVTVRLG